MDFLDSVTGSSNNRLILAVGAGICLVLSRHAQSVLKGTNRFARNLVVAVVLFSFLSTFAWSVSRVSNYYLCFLAAVLVCTLDSRFFVRATFALLLINVGIQSWEYWSHQYLYIYVTKDGLDLTEQAWSGATDIFRAKGFFASPATAADLGVGVSLLRPNSVFALALGMVAATLANGRLAIVAITTILILYVYNYFRLKTRQQPLERRGKFAILLVFLLLLSGFTYRFYSSDPYALDRLLESGSAENSQNAYRIGFWIDGINFYFNYSNIHMLLGNSGAWTRETGYGAAESDWLSLLIETGIAGSLIYCVPFFYLAYAAWRRDRVLLAYMGVLWFILAVNPFVLVPLGGVLYWTFLLRANEYLGYLQMKKIVGTATSLAVSALRPTSQNAGA